MELIKSTKGLSAALGLLAVVGVLAATPRAADAGAAHQCANTVETVTVPAETGRPAQSFKVPVKAISAEGLSCAAAYKFLAQLSKSTQVPDGYKCRLAHFRVPTGYVATACTKRGKKVQYAEHGG